MNDSDLNAELVAHATRRERARLCAVIGVHDRGPDDRCRDCRVLLDSTALTCRTEPTGPAIR